MDQGGELRIKFFTRLSKYEVADTPITAPANFRRAHLSQMINVLLELDPPRPFDFLVNDEFLRVSIGDYVAEHGVYSEEVLPIEFVEAMAPPEPPTENVHDDWVSSLACSSTGLFLSGSYDNMARIWSSAGEQLALMQGHEGPVTAVAWFPQGVAGDGHGEAAEGGARAGGSAASADDDDGGAKPGSLRCVTGSEDETLRTWTVDSAGATTCEEICEAHTQGVTSVAVQPTGAMFASGSADRSIHLWSATVNSDDAGSNVDSSSGGGSKRRKTGDDEPRTKAPLGQLSGSTAGVLAVVWPDRGQLYSAGEDHCVRMWDVETATNTNTMASSKVINALAYSAANNYVAAGCFDGQVRMFDPRSDASAVVAMSLSSHRRPVMSVAWSPTNNNSIASASQDGAGHNLKLWDIRSANIPLHNVAGHEGKVLDVIWPSANLFASGGDDGKLMLHRWNQDGKE